MYSHDSELIGYSTPIQHFYDQWSRCKGIFRCGNGDDSSKQNIDTVFQCVGEIVTQIINETPPQTNNESEEITHRPWLEATLENSIFEALLLWIESSPTSKDDKSILTRYTLRRNLLSLFEQLITVSGEQILHRRPILQPLLQLLYKLSSQLHTIYEHVYGRVLHEVCILLCRNAELLEFCGQLTYELFSKTYLVFSVLVPLLHRNDAVGDSARDALLLVLRLSKSNENLGSYLAFESDLCPVLATGLSGLYSTLPKKLVPRHTLPPRSSESPGGPVSLTTPVFLNPNSSNPCLLELHVGGPEWHHLTESEWTNASDLRRFLHTLDFCNLAVKISHNKICEQLAHFIHSGFLVPVLGSALHQCSMDEVTSATAYLELILRRLTEPLLIKLFLNFIMTGSHDSYQILTTLMNRLNANAVLGMVTLSLFRTILSFHCEDVMYELIFKHLNGLYHLEPEPISEMNENQKLRVSELSLPKLNWSHSPRSSTFSKANSHPSVNYLLPYLVKSAELFISMAETSKPKDKRNMHKSSHPLAKQNEENRQDSDKSSPSSQSQAPANFSNEENITDLNSLNDAMNSNDWVFVRKFNPIIMATNHSQMTNYLKCIHSRISRRRQALKTWSTKYYPKECLNSSQIKSSLSINNDHVLEIEEKQAQNDLKNKNIISIDHNIKLKNQIFDNNSENQIEIDEIKKNDNDEDNSISSPSPIRAINSNLTSSLYQLNYVDDFSDDESILDNTDLSKQTNNSLINQNRSENNKQIIDTNDDNNNNNNVKMNNAHKSKLIINDLPDSHVCSTSSRNNIEQEQNKFPNGECNCLSSLPELLRLAHVEKKQILSGTNNHNDDADYEFETFLAALDCLPSPGHCSTHFGHIPPLLSYPPIEIEFLQKLDKILTNLPNSSVNQIKFDQQSCHIDNSHNDCSLTTTTTTTTTTTNNNNNNNADMVLNSNDSFYNLNNTSECEQCIANISNDISELDSISLDVPESTNSEILTHSDYSSTASPRTKRRSTSPAIAGGIGHFLSILLNRLGNMHLNCLYTNLLLTDIFAALASYPSPILYEFLLNPLGLAVKPGVNTIYKVLRQVRSQIMVASASVDQWDSLVYRARIYLNCAEPCPLKMTIDPNFYNSENRSRSSNITDSSYRNSNEKETKPSSRSKRVVSVDRAAVHSSFHSGSVVSSENYPATEVLCPFTSISTVSPLLPVACSQLPLPNISKPAHRSSVCGSSVPPQTTSGYRFNQFLGLSSRIALSPILKRSPVQSNIKQGLPLHSQYKQVNSDSEDELTVSSNIEISNRTRNLVFASIVFDEFCYELAALCYEHSMHPYFNT